MGLLEEVAQRDSIFRENLKSALPDPVLGFFAHPIWNYIAQAASIPGVMPVGAIEFPIDPLTKLKYPAGMIGGPGTRNIRPITGGFPQELITAILNLKRRYDSPAAATRYGMFDRMNADRVIESNFGPGGNTNIFARAEIERRAREQAVVLAQKRADAIVDMVNKMPPGWQKNLPQIRESIKTYARPEEAKMIDAILTRLAKAKRTPPPPPAPPPAQLPRAK